MKHLLYILGLLILNVPNAAAQKENNNWAFAPGMGMTFNTTPPSLINTATHPDVLANVPWPSAVSDSAGNLLFYISGNAVWDKNHQILQNGNDVFLSPNFDNIVPEAFSKTAHSVVIIPRPGNSKQYYIIANGLGVYLNKTANRLGTYYRLRYSIVDMSLNNGAGAVVSGAKNILLDTSTVDPPIITAGNGSCKKWLLCKKRFTYQLYAYEITSSGISTSPVISTLLTPLMDEIDVSNDNKKIAVKSSNTTYKDYDPSTHPLFVHIYDFDLNTGVVSNGILIDTFDSNIKFVRGMAFSNDNTKFYYNESPTNKIFQYDISKTSRSDIVNSKTFIKNSSGILPWDLTLGPDGRIYQLQDSGRCIIIYNPDRPGAACDAKTVQLTGPWIKNAGTHTMHNQVPVSKVVYSYSDFNTCTLPTQLRSYKDGADSYLWSTGATTQAISANQNGTYWVKASDACGAYRIDTFHVDFNPPRPIADTFSCNGQAIQMPQDAEAIYTWHNNDGPQITKSGRYAVRISKGRCGTIEDTFEAVIYPPLSVSVLPDDTVVCNSNMTATIGSEYELGGYLWNTGAMGKSIEVSQPGGYWLTSNTVCGIYSDTINIGMCVPKIDDVVAEDSTCVGKCVQLSVLTSNFPQQYHWQAPGGTPNVITGTTNMAEVCYHDTGDFSVIAIVSNAGGSDTFVSHIKVLPVPDKRFADTAVTVSYKTMLLLPACAAAARVSWYKNDVLVCDDCPFLRVDARELLAKYVCVVQNANCTDTCSYEVNVTDIPTDSWLPTAFSPNGDGKNDLFRIITDNPNIMVIDLSVYNRFGQRVYRGKGRSGWDGNFKGNPADVGHYYWQLVYRVNGNDKEFYLKGDVVLIR